MGMKSILAGLGHLSRPHQPTGTVCWIHSRDYDYCGHIDMAAGIEPWSRNDWRTRIEDPDAKALTYYLPAARGHDAECVGYILYTVYGPAMSIDRLVVHPKHRRGRIGTELLNKAIALGSPTHKPKSLVAIVHECDVSTQCFLRHHGFTVSQVLRGFFHAEGRDGYSFEREPAGAIAREAAGCRGR